MFAEKYKKAPKSREKTRQVPFLMKRVFCSAVDGWAEGRQQKLKTVFGDDEKEQIEFLKKR